MTDREHGTHNCYVHGPDRRFSGRGCRCEPCRAANSAYERERARRTAPPYVGASEARIHVRELMAAGVGLKTIAKRSKVAHGTLWKLVYGKPGRPPSRRIRPATRDRLLAVMPSDTADGATIPASPTWGVIGTLLERGWTKAAIAGAIGQSDRQLQLSKHKVTAGNARAVKALLDEPIPPRNWRGRLIEQPQIDREAEWRDAMRRAAAAEARAFYRALAAAEDSPEPEPEETPAVDYELPSLAFAERDWMRTAPCRRPEVPVWLFFPGRGDNETVDAAKAVCATCPHQAKCLDLALANNEPGIWGGTSENERRRMRRSAA